MRGSRAEENDMGKRNSSTSKRPSLTVSEETHRQIRLLAAEQNRSIQDVGEELLQLGLSRKEV